VACSTYGREERVVVEGNVRKRVYLEGELDVDGRTT